MGDTKREDNQLEAGGRTNQGCWLYKEKCLQEVPENTYGFIYKITYIGTGLGDPNTGKIYVGKKAFTHSVKKAVSKKVIKETKTRKRVIRTTKDSGWMNYWGSSKELTAHIKEKGQEHFIREILSFCSNKSSLSYQEVKMQIEHKVLEIPSYNNWIGVKVFKSSLLYDPHRRAA